MQPTYSAPLENLPTAEFSSLIVGLDWAKTELGPRNKWPPLLESLTRTILALPSATFLLWGENLVEIYNDAFARIIPDRHPAALGKPVHTSWPEMLQTMQPVYSKVLEGNSAELDESLFRFPLKHHNEELFYSCSLSPVRDGNGNICGILGLITDRTVKVRSELARARLQEEHATLSDQQRVVLDASQLGWWSFDTDKQLIYWDKRVREVYGIDADPAEYSRCLAAMHPDDRAKVGEAVKLALDPENPQGYLIQYRVIRPDGTIRWVQSTGKAQFSGTGTNRKANGFYGTLADITQAKKTEASLRENTQRIRIALNAARLGDWEWDPSSDELKLSLRAAEIFGVIDQRPTTGAGLSELVHPDDLQRYLSVINGAVQTKGDYQIEYRIFSKVVPARDIRRSPDIWIAEHGQCLLDSDGALLRIIGVVQDVTARKQAEADRELLLAQERAGRAEAEHASQMKDEFLATLSHELRTPLNAIVGWSQLLLRRPNLGSDIADGIETIARNGRAQAQMIEDLLDMSRVVSGKLIPNFQRLDIRELIKLAVETVRPSADTKGVLLKLSVPEVATEIKADPNRMQQVIWNLLTNALKFTSKGGSVEVSCERTDTHTVTSITDTGIGITPSFLPYVFDRFRQADASTTRQFGGLGLGLSLVKKLMEIQGGVVRAYSEGKGKGARFTFSMPLYSDSEKISSVGSRSSGSSLMSAEEQTNVAKRLRDLRVLVVDDEHDARMLVKRILEEYQAIVQTAASVAEAIEKLENSTFDFLISDIGMPAEDGYSLAERLRKLSGPHRNIPAIALTAFAGPQDRIRAIRAGFQTHVVKPVDAVELLTVIASFVSPKKESAT